MNNLNKEIGLRVGQLRARQGLTREQLSDLAGISDRFIYDIEIGRKGASAETLFKLSKAFKVTSDYLLFGSEDNSDFHFIIEALKQLDSDDLKSVEKILIDVIEALCKKKS